ncbi:MAG: VWA domain-containing protein [Bacteroidota bacterium]
MKQLLIAFLALISSTALLAQEDKTNSPIVFIYDASGSMWGELEGKTKRSIASSVLSETVMQLSDEQQIGLVAYGHRKQGDCKDVEFLVGIDNKDKSVITTSLKSVKSLGKTPLAYSALQVINKLKVSKTKATIILLTDGIESCDGNLCEVIASAKKEGVGFKLHIVGFGLKAEEAEQLKCATQAGEGEYFDAKNADGLTESLNQATKKTIDELPANFTIHATKNGKQLDVTVRAFDSSSKEEISVGRTYGDTLKIYLPPRRYDLVAKPVGGSAVDAIAVSNVQSLEDEIVHQDINFDAGVLEIQAFNNKIPWDASIRVLRGKKSVATSRTYTKARAIEINPGTYDLLINAMKVDGETKKIAIKNVEIKANETQRIEHNFSTGIIKISVRSGDNLVDATIRIFDTTTGKSVVTSRTYKSEETNPRTFILTEGNYRAEIKALGDYKGKQSAFDFSLKSGEEMEKIIKLN